jgi:hypothetical protein
LLPRPADPEPDCFQNHPKATRWRRASNWISMHTHYYKYSLRILPPNALQPLPALGPGQNRLQQNFQPLPALGPGQNRLRPQDFSKMNIPCRLVVAKKISKQNRDLLGKWLCWRADWYRYLSMLNCGTSPFISATSEGMRRLGINRCAAWSYNEAVRVC